jgi:hypothetical protein
VWCARLDSEIADIKVSVARSFTVCARLMREMDVSLLRQYLLVHDVIVLWIRFEAT